MQEVPLRVPFLVHGITSESYFAPLIQAVPSMMIPLSEIKREKRLPFLKLFHSDTFPDENQLRRSGLFLEEGEVGGSLFKSANIRVF